MAKKKSIIRNLDGSPPLIYSSKENRRTEFLNNCARGPIEKRLRLIEEKLYDLEERLYEVAHQD